MRLLLAAALFGYAIIMGWDVWTTDRDLRRKIRETEVAIEEAMRR